MKTKGFTLIELLVVISIIGILSGIVMTSLGSARERANEAAVLSNLSQIRPGAEIYYNSNNNYGNDTDSCNGGIFNDDLVSPFVKEENYPNDYEVSCKIFDDGQAYRVSVENPDGNKIWCVDSNRFLDEVDNVGQNFCQ
ncbi:MAG: type II secretion system protein [Patescibacteria group bacterium]